ncbi:hypothetical protein CDN99_06430 [Roseateles aquatilis]|uniref:Ice-binding protein C-terminal domain-containing protein n=1 Tax=Roseateles aquatilis TaxID=431061 RepID=A0A246JHG1_9BURK|nr:PEP-CTERM sorting domain-containing protein [Roseateles aquatilis]OWQ91992.1 hypothetical protein CDN99_06430 [Roseateles aquatilis]
MTRPTSPISWIRATLAAALCAVGVAAQASVLILGAPQSAAGLSDIQQKIEATGLIGGTVDVFNVGSGTPTLAMLRAYDSVMVFSDAPYANAVTLGDVLANYVDAGGGVVEAAFSHFSAPLRGLSGRFVSQNYDVFNISTNQPSCGSLGVVSMPGSALMVGVHSFDGGPAGTCNKVTLKANTQLVASWTNNQPLLAYRLDHNAPVIGLNMYPVSGDAVNGLWDVTTDGAVLMANALSFVARVNGVPEPGSLALIAIAALAAGAATRRRRA